MTEREAGHLAALLSALYTVRDPSAVYLRRLKALADERGVGDAFRAAMAGRSPPGQQARRHRTTDRPSPSL